MRTSSPTHSSPLHNICFSIILSTSLGAMNSADLTTDSPSLSPYVTQIHTIKRQKTGPSRHFRHTSITEIHVHADRASHYLSHHSKISLYSILPALARASSPNTMTTTWPRAASFIRPCRSKTRVHGLEERVQEGIIRKGEGAIRRGTVNLEARTPDHFLYHRLSICLHA